MTGNNKNAVLSMVACCLSIFGSGFVCFGFPGVMGIYWQDIFSVGPSETGLVVTFMLLALAVAMFFSGKVHMKIGMRKCILIGLGFGTLITISGPIISGIFGLKYLGMIFGLVFTGYGLVGGIAGPALAGIILEKTGNYTIVFSYLGIFALIGAALIYLVKKMKHLTHK